VEHGREGARRQAAVAGARQGAGAAMPGLAFAPLVESLRRGVGQALEAEAERGRIILWAPVALAAGILGYFALPREPSAPALLGLTALLAAAAWSARRAELAGPVLLALLLTAAGFSAAKIRTDLVAGPVLWQRHGPALVEGTVRLAEQREKALRITLDVGSVARLDPRLTPRRVVVSWRGVHDPPRIGDRLQLRAVLTPPPGPVMPGAYHYARDLFFAEVGATGFLVGAPTLLPEIEHRPADRARLALGRLRAEVTRRILDTLPGETGAIAAALLTGERAQIPEDTNDALRASGLAHILSISGMHMVLFAGTLFGAARLLLAAVPSLALRRPIRKWAAGLGILGATGYVLLSGASVPAVRAYLMILIMFLAILAGRRALTMRNVALAAFLLLLLQPESILSASFQMSFAATIALISAYEALAGRLGGHRADGGALGLALLPVRHALGLMTTSLVAGAATFFFAAYHFHTATPFGVAGNLLAMPVTGLVVMPMGLAALILMPFGLDPLALAVMGWGLDWVLAVARFVASWGGAVVGVPAFPPSVLLLAAGSGLWLCLWTGRWRLGALGGLALALVMAPMGRSPADLLIEADGRTMAVRGSDGRFAIAGLRSGRFAAARWLEAEADPRALDDPSLRREVTCDRAVCTAKLRDGAVVAMVLDRKQLRQWCDKAQIFVSPWVAPRRCASGVVVDGLALARGGSHALWLGIRGDPPVVQASLDPERPWDAWASEAAAERLRRLTAGRARPSAGEPQPQRPDTGSRRGRRSAPSVAPQQGDEAPLDADPVGPEDPGFVSRIGGFEGD